MKTKVYEKNDFSLFKTLTRCHFVCQDILLFHQVEEQ